MIRVLFFMLSSVAVVLAPQAHAASAIAAATIRNYDFGGGGAAKLAQRLFLASKEPDRSSAEAKALQICKEHLALLSGGGARNQVVSPCRIERSEDAGFWVMRASLTKNGEGVETRDLYAFGGDLEQAKKELEEKCLVNNITTCGGGKPYIFADGVSMPETKAAVQSTEDKTLSAEDFEILTTMLKALPNAEIVSNNTRFAAIPKIMLLRYTGEMGDAALEAWKNQFAVQVIKPWCENEKKWQTEDGFSQRMLSGKFLNLTLYRLAEKPLPPQSFFNQWVSRMEEVGAKAEGLQNSPMPPENMDMKMHRVDYPDSNMACLNPKKPSRESVMFSVLDSALVDHAALHARSRSAYRALSGYRTDESNAKPKPYLVSTLGRQSESPRTVYVMVQTFVDIAETEQKILAPFEERLQLAFKERGQRAEQKWAEVARKALPNEVEKAFRTWSRDWARDRYVENSAVVMAEGSRMLRSPQTKDNPCHPDNKKKWLRGGGGILGGITFEICQDKTKWGSPAGTGIFYYHRPKKVGERQVGQKVWSNGYIEPIYEPVYKGYNKFRGTFTAEWVLGNKADGSLRLKRLCYDAEDGVDSDCRNFDQ